MSEQEIIERVCNGCGKKEQHPKHVVDGIKFHGWYRVIRVKSASMVKKDFCCPRCLSAYAIGAEEVQKNEKEES